MPSRPASTKDLEGPTGRSWDQWLEFFEKANFADLPHGEIARRLHDAGVPDWWSQMLTVAYEQHIGRRAPGQGASGNFSTSVSRTVEGEMADVARRVRKSLGRARTLGGLGLAELATTSDTPKRSYWRATLADGTRVQVALEPKAGGKTMINATHERLDSPESVERWRAFWKEALSAFS